MLTIKSENEKKKSSRQASLSTVLLELEVSLACELYSYSKPKMKPIQC